MPSSSVINNNRNSINTLEVGWPAFVSGALHIIAFILVITGLPNISKNNEIHQEDIIMNVELFDPSQVLDENKTDNEDKKEDIPPPPKKPIYNKSDIVPDLAEPKKPETIEPDKKEEEHVEKIVEDPTLIKVPPKPKSKPKPPQKPKVEKKVKEKPKEETSEPQKDITSLLKDLTPDEAWSNAKDIVNDKTDKSSNTTESGNASTQMTVSDLVALNQGVQPCWNVNAGARFAENMEVKLHVIVGRDRVVQDVIVKDTLRYSTDQNYRAAADAAIWALRNPKCSTLNLPPEKYDTWKSFIYVFDPSQML